MQYHILVLFVFLRKVGLDNASSAIRVKLLAGRVLTTCMADAATFPRTAGLPDASAWPGPCSYFVCATLAWLMQPRGLADAAAAVNGYIAPIDHKCGQCGTNRFPPHWRSKL